MFFLSSTLGTVIVLDPSRLEKVTNNKVHAPKVLVK
jgi:hypothetical protein